MQDRSPSEHHDRDCHADVDPDKLDSLVREAVERLESGNTAPAEGVLSQLDEQQRETYREPLLDRLARVAVATIDTSHSIQRDTDDDDDDDTDDAATIEPFGIADASAETIALPPAARRPKKKSDTGSLPESIGKFRIKGELGRGAFGVVYLGFDEELQRNVAIKVSLVSDPKLQERLRVEASKAAQIESNGIVPVYHIGKTDNGKVYIVQKYIEGSTLRDVIKKAPLSPDCASRLMREIALGLEPAHLQDIIHRDLKPDNILISQSGRAWIADFGLAISEEEQQERKAELAGTPPYMSPEQIKGRIDFLDPRSDIWALGVMYYELLSGKLPFVGKSRDSLKQQICDRDPRPLHQIAPDHLSMPMHRVFERCCAKQPADRYASVRELADDLEDLIFEGLSDQNIHGENMTSGLGLGSSEYETAGSQFRTGRHTTRGSRFGAATHVGSTRASTIGGSAATLRSATGKETTSPRRLVGLALIALLVAGVVAYPFYLKLTIESDREPLGEIVAAADLSPTRTAPVPPARSELAGVSSPIEVSERTDAPMRAAAAATSEAEATAADVSQDPVPVPAEPTGMGLDQANGSEEKPWVVSADGTGSHRTIGQAVAASSPDEFIRVMAGVYREALQISKPLTIVGQTTGDDQEMKFLCSLSNDQASPLDIDCPQGKVVIRGMAINGEGHHTTKEFNAVNLTGGTLLMEDCQLRTSSFNCIKVRGDAALGVRNCQFLDSREFAISTKDHQTVQATGCTFLRSGVQLVGGTGRIERCDFFGNHGCYVSRSLQEVQIIDCTFDQCQDYGIASASGGEVLVKNTELLDCELALNLQHGALTAGQGSRIEGGRMAAGVTSGTLNLTDVSITDLDHGIVVTDNAEVTLKQLFIKGCRDTAILMQSGSLSFQQGSVEDCSVGAMLGGESSWQEFSVTSTIESVDFSRCASYAIAVYSGPTKLSDLDISECLYGVYVHGPEKPTRQAGNRGAEGEIRETDQPAANLEDAEAAPLQVSAENIRFRNVEKAAVLARGHCTVRHQGLQDESESQSRGAVAVGGAEVIAVEP